MSKLKIDAIEEFVAEVEGVFKECGLQDRLGKSKSKYYFFRGSIPNAHASDKIVVRYIYTQNLPTEADNQWHSLDVYINATVFINSQDGFNDADYKHLVRLLEEKCIEHKIALEYGIDSSDYTIGDISTEAKSREIELSKIIKRS